MKKALPLFCVILMIAMFIGGCTNTGSPAQSPSEADPQQAAEAATRIVSTVMGDIEVPANPQRVIVNWYIGDVFTLGLNVVGHAAWEQETMPFYDKFAASTKIENWEPEALMTLEPDLIITYKQEDFEKFNKVAPVLVIPESGITSLERVKIIGDATGRTAEAEAAVANFEARLADAKKTLKSGVFEDKTFSIMEDWGPSGEWSGVAYETGSRGGTLVYKYLELQYPDKLKALIEESGKGRGTLSYEVAHEYFGDYILWFKQEGKESEYAKTEIWKSIPAVAEGRLVEIRGEYLGLFYYSDVTSLTAQLDYMVNAINSLAK